jgi:hypothetical protein
MSSSGHHWRASISGGNGQCWEPIYGSYLDPINPSYYDPTGIPTEWQDFMVGILLNFFICLPFIRNFITKNSVTPRRNRIFRIFDYLWGKN